jgi:hypothetical protein
MATFSITGEFITEKVRDMWRERNFEDALNYLSNTIPEMNREQQLQLIEGEMKLTGKDVLDFVEDDWNPDDEYPNFSEALSMKKESEILYDEKFKEDYNDALDIIEKFNKFHDTYATNPDKHFEREIDRWNMLLPEVRKELEEKIPYMMCQYIRVVGGVCKFRGLEHYTIASSQFPKRVWENYDLFIHYCDKYAIYGTIQRNEIWDNYHNIVKRITTPDETDIKEALDKKTMKFKTDYKMQSQFGWLSREGIYYTCYYTGHNSLADLICEKYDWYEEDRDGSAILESKGWVKIHTPDDHRKGITLFSHSCEYISKEQEKKILRYCKYHEIVAPNLKLK